MDEYLIKASLFTTKGQYYQFGFTAFFFAPANFGRFAFAVFSFNLGAGKIIQHDLTLDIEQVAGVC
jgi:hypothetical protein